MANNEKVVLIARLKVKEDAIEEAKRAALAIVADSRAEEGCLNYDFHQAIDDPTLFFLARNVGKQICARRAFQETLFR